MAATGQTPQFASLYVGDLHTDVTEAMLYEVFNSIGPVGSIRVCRDSITRKSLGYGYVNFHFVKDAERAIADLNYSAIKGKSCRLGWSKKDPVFRKNDDGNVYVRNLDPNIDNKALYDTFSAFGKILSCKAASDIGGKMRGYGFVHFETGEAAQKAIDKVNGMQIGEKTVEVCLCRKRDQADEKEPEVTNLYVKHFPDDWDNDKLEETFKPFGKVVSHCATKDAQGRPFGFVNYETVEEAKAAISALHKKDMRTEDQIKADEEAKKEMENDPDGFPLHCMFVGKKMTKAQRKKDLREKFSAQKGAAGTTSGVNLFVKNLSEDMDDAEFRELFEPYGSINSVACMKDDQGKCKGFGFVCYASPAEATRAVTEMHLNVVHGKPLYVGLAEKREDRQERLQQRYSAPSDKGKGKGKGKAAFSRDYSGMGPHHSVGGPQAPPMGAMMPPMMGMGRPHGLPPQMMMPPPMMGKGFMPGPGGLPPQQMMAMMASKGGPNPHMMAMMAAAKGGAGFGGMGKPGMPLGPMPGPIPPQMLAMMQAKGAMGGKSMQAMMAQKGMLAAAGKGGYPFPGAMPPQRPTAQDPAPLGAIRPPSENVPLSAAALAAAPPAMQKQMLGEKLYPAIAKFQPELAGKLTGMMLEMDNSELLILLESSAMMKDKVDEALGVLEGRAQ